MMLSEVAEFEIEESGMVLSPACQELVAQLVTTGDAAVAREPYRREEAEGHLRTWIRSMVENARSEHAETIDQRHYIASMQLCPLWPFC